MISKCVIVFVTMIEVITGVTAPRQFTTGASVIENSIFNSYFPDVSYPTSIFDITEPFFYKPQVFDTPLKPFTDDVRASYKRVSSTLSRGKNIKSKSVEKDSKSHAIKNVSLCVTKPNGQIECAKVKDKDVNEQNYPVWVVAEEYTGIDNTENVCDIIEEAVSEYILKTEQIFDDHSDTRNDTILTETPQNVRINIDVIKGVARSDDNTITSDVDVLLVKAVPENLNRFHNNVLPSINNEMLKKIDMKYAEQFTRLEEVNTTNLHESLTKVLYEPMDGIQNASSEVLILQPLIDERIPSNDNKVDSTVLDSLIGLNNVKLIIITAKNKTISLNDTDENTNIDKEIPNERRQLDDNYFLDFVISLNDLFQDKDIRMLNIPDAEANKLINKETEQEKLIVDEPFTLIHNSGQGNA